MAGTTILEQVRAALRQASARTEGLVETVPDTRVPMPGSKWTVREASVHLVNVGVRYAGMVQGEPLGYESLAPEECARMNDQLIADIPESDPLKLAALIHEGTEGLLAATARCDDEQTVLWHCQTHVPIPNFVAIVRSCRFRRANAPSSRSASPNPYMGATSKWRIPASYAV